MIAADRPWIVDVVADNRGGEARKVTPRTRRPCAVRAADNSQLSAHSLCLLVRAVYNSVLAARRGRRVTEKV